MIRIRLKFADETDRGWTVDGLLNAGYITIEQKVGDTYHVYFDVEDEDVILPPDLYQKLTGQKVNIGDEEVNIQEPKEDIEVVDGE